MYRRGKKSRWNRVALDGEGFKMKDEGNKGQYWKNK